MIAKCVDPLIDMLAVAPTLHSGAVHLLGSLLEGRGGERLALVFAAFGRIDALIGERPVLGRACSSLSECNFVYGSQTEVATATVDRKTELPSPAAVVIDFEV